MSFSRRMDVQILLVEIEGLFAKWLFDLLIYELSCSARGCDLFGYLM